MKSIDHHSFTFTAFPSTPDTLIIDIHTHHTSPTASLTVYNLPESRIFPESSLYVSSGLHPWHLRQESLTEKLRQLEEMASDNRILLIGECGLDKVCKVDFELQIKAFRAQIDLANRIHKPLILHCVRAHNETLNLLREARNKVPVIFHGFNKSSQLASAIIREGHYLSLGADLLKEHMSQVVASIPPDRMLLESDEHDVDMTTLYERSAQLLGMSVQELENQIELNVHTILGPDFRMV